MNFYSQQKEDEILFQKYLNYNNGFFIELGAMDGIQYSNTYFFELNLGWSGILIEPNYNINILRHNRPNSYCYNVAISQKNDFVEFIGDGALGGIKNLMSDQHINGWNINRDDSKIIKSVTLKSILNDVTQINKKINKVDFLSLDVEGGELEVLKSYDWSIPIYVILIEMSDYNLEKNQECRDIMISNGFEFDMVIGCNEVWINHKNK
jgi:FkbM family methyltransferase